MADKVLLFIEDRALKGIVLRVLYEKNLEFREGLDDKDLRLKLDIFKDTILFSIIQINKVNYKEQYKLIKRIKQDQDTARLPVIALIPGDTVEYVGGAKNAGIEEVILIPKKRELFRNTFTTRLTHFIKNIHSTTRKKDEGDCRKKAPNALVMNDELKQELKRAERGRYSISFVMGRFTGVDIGLIQDFHQKVKKEMRDTDKIVLYDYHCFIMACPFTVKSYQIEVEKKIRKAFEASIGSYSTNRRLDMYGVTYPDDGKSIEKLTEIMEKGVHDSSIISSIREPLNTISRERLEEYRKMLKLFK